MERAQTHGWTTYPEYHPVNMPKIETDFERLNSTELYPEYSSLGKIRNLRRKIIFLKLG